MNTPLKKHLFSSQIDLAKFSPASEDEKSQQEVMSESTTFFRDGMKKLMRNPLAVGAIVVLVLLILTIIIAPDRRQPRPLHLVGERAAVYGGDRRAAVPPHLRHR